MFLKGQSKAMQNPLFLFPSNTSNQGSIHSTSSAGPTNAYAVRVRSVPRPAGAATARRTAIDSANAVLPLAGLLGCRLDLFHHLLAGLAAGETACQPWYSASCTAG